MGNYVLVSVPLFIFMACTLERAGVADSIFRAVHVWFGGVPGGLAVAVIFSCALMATMVGVIGAEIVTMGVIALPAMLSRGYDKRIALGSICAGGGLATLIPIRVSNLLAAAKNISTTHITNGCFRLHPVEWNIGEAAGAFAAFCLQQGRLPAAVHRDAELRRAFQQGLLAEAFHSPGPSTQLWVTGTLLSASGAQWRQAQARLTLLAHHCAATARARDHACMPDQGFRQPRDDRHWHAFGTTQPSGARLVHP